MKIKLRRTNLYLTQIQYDAIKKLSGDKQITFSEQFRSIVDFYLEKKLESHNEN